MIEGRLRFNFLLLLFITFNQVALVTGHQMIEETESELEGDDKEWWECESKSVNLNVIQKCSDHAELPFNCQQTK